MAITIRDIARRCEVSVATVSKALNGYADISPATREKVRQAVAEMGYLPNGHAQALKTHRSFNLGVLFMDRKNHGLRNSFFAGLLSAFREEAAKAGYDITFISHTLGQRAATFLEHCYYRHVDGVCIASVDFAHPDVLALVRSDIPVITIDHVYPKTDAILSDNRGGMSAMVRYIAERGHRRIGYIHGEMSWVTQLRIQTMKDTLAELNLPLESGMIRLGRYHNSEYTQQQVERWLNEPNPPTCIIVSDDYSAIGAYQAVHTRGLSIPENISLAGYDGIDLSQTFTPPLTTVWQDTDKIGISAAQRLIARVEGRADASPSLLWIPSKLIIRRYYKRYYISLMDLL